MLVPSWEVEAGTNEVEVGVGVGVSVGVGVGDEVVEAEVVVCTEDVEVVVVAEECPDGGCLSPNRLVNTPTIPPTPPEPSEDCEAIGVEVDSEPSGTKLPKIPPRPSRL